MKKIILISALVLGSFYNVFGQTGKPRHMILTIAETSFGGHSPNVFITRDDTAQLQQYVSFNLHIKNKDATAAHENRLIQLLEPYYNAGWKLITTSVEPITGGNLARYFFIKNE